MLCRGKLDCLYKNLDMAIKGLPMRLSAVNKDEITILATNHTLFIAHGLEQELEAYGIHVSIVTDLGDSDHGQLFIVISPQVHPVLPWNYIAYQVEQILASNWFNENYKEILLSSHAILDYSSSNIKALQDYSFPSEHLHFLPVAPILNYEEMLLGHQYHLPPHSK